MAVRSSRRDVVKLRDAVSAQWAALVAYTESLSADQLAAASALPGWSVNELIAHLAQGVSGFTARLLLPAGPSRATVDLAGWARATPAFADQLAEGARQAAAAGMRLDQTVAAAVTALAAETEDRPIVAPGGAMALSDVLVTRVVEAVVHADDLDPDFPHAPAALATATRALADLLAGSAPGHTVEVRVPPYAVVQCVAGPRHTRGTPPNVVETDPRTWLRLATGRLTWSNAAEAGLLTASGERSDISGHLPVLR